MKTSTATPAVPPMRIALICTLLIAFAPAAQRAAAQSGEVLSAAPLQVEKLDKAADAIIPAGAQLEKVATGFKWVEGPVWTDHSLYFASITSNAIMHWVPGKGATTLLTPSGYLGKAPFMGPEPGSNGMTLDPKGRLTVAGHAQRDVYRMESLSGKAPITVLADSYKGKRLNSPNDLVYSADGALYFTDPPYGLESQSDHDAKKELQVNGVYRLAHAAAQKAGTAPDHAALELLSSDFTRPNGIAFSPDEKYLYVNNSEPKKFWMRFRVKPDGTLADGKVICDATADTRPGAPDGMKVDVEGNIYSAAPGGVWILSPEGKHLATIVMPEKTANVAWGGPDRKTLYIAASTSIYRVRLKIAGVPLRGAR